MVWDTDFVRRIRHRLQSDKNHIVPSVEATNSPTLLGKGWWWLSCGLGLMAQAVLLWCYYLPKPKQLIGDEGYYFNLAKNLAAGIPVEHHPFWPPLYGEFLGVLFNLFGETIWMVQCIQIGFLFMSAWFLRDALWRLTQHSNLANVAASMFLLCPELVAFSHYLWPETLHLLFMLGAFWAWVRWSKDLWPGVIVGIFIALALLTKLLLLPLLPMLAVALLILSKKRRETLGRLLVMVATLAVLLTPTMWSNHQRHGKWMIADSSLFNVWVGLNDSEPADYRNDIAGPNFLEWEASGATWVEKNRVYRDKLDFLIAEKGWLKLLLDQFPTQYRRLFDPHTFLVTQLPGGARAAYAGQPGAGVGLVFIWAWLWHGVMLAFAGAGVCLVGWRRPSFWWFCGGFLIFNLALFWWVHVKTRYMLQMYPALLPFSALAMVSLWQRWRQGVWQKQVAVNQTRLWLAGCLGLILLLLAFWPR